MEIRFLGSGLGPPTDALDVLTAPLQTDASIPSGY